MNLLEKAQNWAAKGHLTQTRKFSGIPYIVHPEAVAEIIGELTDDEDVLSAAWMHDLVEDTVVTVEDIRREFNDVIADMVWEVSKVSKKSDGIRVKRFLADIDHYSKGSKWSKAIKLADAIHNLPTMIRDNPDFAPKYVAEKKFLLPFIEGGSPLLASILQLIIEQYETNHLTVLDLYGKIVESKKAQESKS